MTKYFLYTDGSHSPLKNLTISAFIILDEENNLVTKGRSSVGENKAFQHHSEIAELRAVILGLKAIRKLDKSNQVEVTIFTDYQGIVYFHELMDKASGNIKIRQKFKAKKRQPFYSWYYSNLCNIFELYRRMDKELMLSFNWVKGHSGDVWNEEADRLTKLKIKRSC